MSKNFWIFFKAIPKMFYLGAMVIKGIMAY